MRLRKGSKVEVFDSRRIPSGSWHRAEIVSGNGHYYKVKFEPEQSQSIDGEVITEKIPRKLIRTYPFVELEKTWVPGDVAEVFDGNSWKLGEIKRVIGESYLMRIVKSSLELKVHKRRVRERQPCWDERWTAIKMGQRNSSGKECTREVPKENHFRKLHSSLEVNDNIANQQFCNIISRNTKRISQDLRLIKQEGRPQLNVPSMLLEKVDAVASPQNVMDEKHMRFSFNNQKFEMPEIAMHTRIQNRDVGYSNSRRIETRSDDDESLACSVDSCSISSYNPSNYDDLAYELQTYPSHGVKLVCGSKCGGEYSIPTENALSEEIHRLELDAYRSTLKALFASGPLSWEQEALITNLRLMLHISNDVHLRELRNLVSSKTVLSVN